MDPMSPPTDPQTHEAMPTLALALVLLLLLVIAMARRSASFDAIAGGTEVVYRINPNTAGIEELSLLPGVGPPTAQKIIDYRNATGPFETASDLENVSGIAGKTRAAIQPWVRIGQAEATD